MEAERRGVGDNQQAGLPSDTAICRSRSYGEQVANGLPGNGQHLKKKKTGQKITMQPGQGTGLRGGKVGQRGRRESGRQGKAERSPSHVREHLTGAGE